MSGFHFTLISPGNSWGNDEINPFADDAKKAGIFLPFIRD
jgi:hypothetical protein